MAINDIDFEFIRAFVRDRSAVSLDADKRYLVEARLAPILRGERYESIGGLIEELRARPRGRLHDHVVEAMTTNETSFYRDRRPFELLCERIIPDLIERRADRRRLRIWCNACSSGQEPYTVAMVIHEHFPELADWDVEVLGTDLSREMIARCEQARYSQLEVNRGLPAQLLVKYFRKVGSEWQVNDDIRRCVRFEQMNLIEPWRSVGKWDVMFLRNVLIYFEIDTKREVLRRARRVLADDGYLFLGGAETTLNLADDFERLPDGRAGCYHVREDARSAHAVR